MTNIPTDDSRLLILFGEMRGDLKSLLRVQEELNGRLRTFEDDVDVRIGKLDTRIKALEAIRLKVAGFTAALGLVAGAFSDKALKALTTLTGG